jgi:hypothetical protein
MAGRGPAPKSAATRQRKNKKPSAAVLKAKPRARVPKLPQVMDLDDEGTPITRVWHPQTKIEWAAIWKSPMASQFIDTDGAGLAKLIVLIDDWWKATTASSRKELSSEIRLQRLEFGLTPVARSRLQWEAAKAAEAEGKVKRAGKASRARAKKPVDPRAALHEPPAPLRVVEGGAGTA